MPELPEVETIARGLREGTGSIVGRTIARAELSWARTLAEPLPDMFRARLPGQTVQAVGRRGKFLVITLSLDSLLLHLRMSGDVRVEATQPLRKHDRLALEFTDGDQLAFNDARKFGRAWLVDDPRRITGALGPEPFDPDFTPAALYARLHGAKRQIKPLLLDQTFLAGLGNIYTDESLHAAGIHPLRLSNSIREEEAARLHAAIRATLQEGIRRNGASIDWVYRGGDFQNAFAAYQRTGQPCPRCGAPIQRILVGQRGTHFCPICQPLG